MDCRYAGVCGGCSLLTLSYRDQLARKERTLSRLLGDLLPALTRTTTSAAQGRSVAGSGAPSQSVFLPVPGQSGSPTGFRQKVAFVFGRGASPQGSAQRVTLTMGHFERGSTRVVDIAECPVHSARGNRIAFALRDYLSEAGLAAADSGRGAAGRASVPGTGAGILRHVIVRVTADEREAVAMLVVTRNDRALRAPVRRLLASDERPDGFFVNVHPAGGAYMVGERTLRVEGRSHIREEVGGVSYLVSPTAFFQTNVSAAAVLQRHVVDSMAGAERVLDLYCGGGLFSLPLAMSGVHVCGVEESPQAVADARANARLNGVPSSLARFIEGRVEQAWRTVGRTPWDGVILDPPRQGCSDDVLQRVFVDLAPPRVTYVSCNPQALAAELPGIVECGYRVADVRAVDMFPHTDHIEAVVTLRRRRT